MVVGGIIPQADHKGLLDLGVGAIFTPGVSILSVLSKWLIFLINLYRSGVHGDRITLTKNKNSHKSALARGITLVCSHLESDQKKAELLIKGLLKDKSRHIE